MNRVQRSKGSTALPSWDVACLSGLLLIASCTREAPENRDALNKIRPAPAFELVTQSGQRQSLRDLHGKVAVIAFVYTSCPSGCSPLTATLASLSNRLDPGLRSRVHFTFITLNPKQDTPEVLRRYAASHQIDLTRSAFLTGSEATVRSLAREFGVVSRVTSEGQLDHTFLTSIVDQQGVLRVQYTGVQFDPDELLADLESLVRERS